LLVAAAILFATSAHVGSPDTWFGGDAGPYRLVVHVRSPTVIPGSAELQVRVEGEPPDEVLAWVAPREGEAPSPAVSALPAGEDPGTFEARLAVSEAGPSSVTVRARGARGEGELTVPVTFLPLQRVELTGPMAAGLGIVLTLLLGGLVAGVGAAVRDLPEAGPSPESRRLARVAMGATTALIAVGLFSGKRWLDEINRAFLAETFRPLAATAEVSTATGGPEIVVRITDQAWGPGGRGTDGDLPIILDHGKLMHMFLVAEDRSTFAHLHPSTDDSVTFHAWFPPLGAGRYHVFGEVTHAGGLTQTVMAPLEVPATEGHAPPPDADDSWNRGEATDDVSAALADGSVLQWARGSDPVVADAPAPLRFTLADSAGVPLPIEPYMGMLGHAALLRDDDSVFVHVHPSGTVSAAAQLELTSRPVADTLPDPLAAGGPTTDAAHMLHAGYDMVVSAVSFPYAFPSAGRYHLWVQLKHRGRVLTGAFRVEVGPGRS
jgi:hypothetical protein